MYLNDKIIDILDLVTCKSFLTGVYKKPFWEIELKIANSSKSETHNVVDTRKIYFTDVVNKEIQPHRYFTRSNANTNTDKNIVELAEQLNSNQANNNNTELDRTDTDICNKTVNASAESDISVERGNKSTGKVTAKKGTR